MHGFKNLLNKQLKQQFIEIKNQIIPALGPGYENFEQEIRFNGSNALDENENHFNDNDYFSEQLMDLEA